MRSVEEIINELCNHPQCLHIEAYTKEDILWKLKWQWSKELNVPIENIDLKIHDLNDEDWRGIADQIRYWHDAAIQYARGGPLEVSEDSDEELYLRLGRQIKLNLLLI